MYPHLTAASTFMGVQKWKDLAFDDTQRTAAAISVCSLSRNGVPATRSVAGCPWRGGVGRGWPARFLFCGPLPVPPAEVGFIRLRPVNRWPNSGKPEFGRKRGRGRKSRAFLSVVTDARALANRRVRSQIEPLPRAPRALPRHSAADIRALIKPQ